MTIFRPTIRLRLTLVYGGLFLVAGILLLSVTYLLMNRNLPVMARAMPTVPAETTDAISITKSVDGQAAVQQVSDTAFLKGLEESRQATLNSMLTQGGIALLLTGTAALGLGWLFAGRALRPVHQVTETARRVALSHDLSERIAFDGPDDDIKELVTWILALRQ